MIDKENIRKYDFISSIILIIFSLLIIKGATGMPMEGSYGGVQNQWYVSPALLPLIIGFGLLLLSLVLLANSIITGGAKQFIAAAKTWKRSAKLSESTVRVLVTVLMLFNLIYILIPRVDFFIALTFFLLSVMGIFYIDDEKIIKKVALIVTIWTLISLLLVLTGISAKIFQGPALLLDVYSLIMYFHVLITLIRSTKGNAEYRKKFKTILIISLIVPTILCPLFRYVLLVPLPVEGLIFDRIFNSIYYALR